MFTPRFFELEVFGVDFFLEAFFGAAALRDRDFVPAADFFDAFFFDADFPGLLAALREADFFAVVFFRDAFLGVVFLTDFLAVFFADLPAALRATVFFDDFLRAAVLLLDVAFTLDFFRLTLRLLPVVFLRPAALRGAAFLRLAPALFRFLLAVFFAGIRTPAGSEKNAELYIARPNMEAQKQRFFACIGRGGIWGSNRIFRPTEEAAGFRSMTAVRSPVEA